MKYILSLTVFLAYSIVSLNAQIRIVASFESNTGTFEGDGILVQSNPELVSVISHSGGIQNIGGHLNNYSYGNAGRSNFYNTSLKMPLGTLYAPLLIYAFNGDEIDEIIIEYRDFQWHPVEGDVIRRFTLQKSFVASCKILDGEQATYELQLNSESIKEEYFQLDAAGKQIGQSEYIWNQVTRRSEGS